MAPPLPKGEGNSPARETGEGNKPGGTLPPREAPPDPGLPPHAGGAQQQKSPPKPAPARGRALPWLRYSRSPALPSAQPNRSPSATPALGRGPPRRFRPATPVVAPPATDPSHRLSPPRAPQGRPSRPPPASHLRPGRRCRALRAAGGAAAAWRPESNGAHRPAGPTASASARTGATSGTRSREKTGGSENGSARGWTGCERREGAGLRGLGRGLSGRGRS